jgi:hypothetical protein
MSAGHAPRPVICTTCLVSRNKPVIGTFNALGKEDSVERDGEIEPFSILDNMPADIPEATPNSATVKSKLFRSLLTSAPISDSRVGVASFGADEPVRRAGSSAGPRAVFLYYFNRVVGLPPLPS